MMSSSKPPGQWELNSLSSEYNDADTNIFELFAKFNTLFFDDALQCVDLKWSPCMTSGAGFTFTRYTATGAAGCTIVLSEPILKSRSGGYLIETLLHEMIHAYLFVTENVPQSHRDYHSPKFIMHMVRINSLFGANISEFHSMRLFQDDVGIYESNGWKCDGPCVKKLSKHGKVGFGVGVGMEMDGALSQPDLWYAEHQRACGGILKKIIKPEESTVSKRIGSSKMSSADKLNFRSASVCSTISDGYSRSITPVQDCKRNLKRLWEQISIPESNLNLSSASFSSCTTNLGELSPQRSCKRVCLREYF